MRVHVLRRMNKASYKTKINKFFFKTKAELILQAKHKSGLKNINASPSKLATKPLLSLSQII